MSKEASELPAPSFHHDLSVLDRNVVVRLESTGRWSPPQVRSRAHWVIRDIRIEGFSPHRYRGQPFSSEQDALAAALEYAGLLIESRYAFS